MDDNDYDNFVKQVKMITNSEIVPFCPHNKHGSQYKIDCTYNKDKQMYDYFPTYRPSGTNGFNRFSNFSIAPCGCSYDNRIY